jgi:hypothetical protein
MPRLLKMAAGGAAAALLGVGLLTAAPAGASTGWTVQHVPKLASATKRTALASVSCVSGGTCTAVGYATAVPARGTALQMLYAVREVGGGAWAVQAVPEPADYSTGQLTGVSCTSASSCVAVGYYQNTANVVEALTETFDGTSWTIQAIPDPAGSIITNLTAVSCSAATACMAVGIWTTGGDLLRRGRLRRDQPAGRDLGWQRLDQHARTGAVRRQKQFATRRVVLISDGVHRGRLHHSQHDGRRERPGRALEWHRLADPDRAVGVPADGRILPDDRVVHRRRRDLPAGPGTGGGRLEPSRRLDRRDASHSRQCDRVRPQRCVLPERHHVHCRGLLRRRRERPGRQAAGRARVKEYVRHRGWSRR